MKGVIRVTTVIESFFGGGAKVSRISFFFFFHLECEQPVSMHCIHHERSNIAVPFAKHLKTFKKSYFYTCTLGE